MNHKTLKWQLLQNMLKDHEEYVKISCVVPFYKTFAWFCRSEAELYKTSMQMEYLLSKPLCRPHSPNLIWWYTHEVNQTRESTAKKA